MATIRSLYSFEQFETVLQKLAHKMAIDAITKLNQGRVRIQTNSNNEFERFESDKYAFTFYAHHIGYSRMTKTGKGTDYWGFDIEEKEYSNSNHRTKISFFVAVEGKYDKDSGKYAEPGRPEKEHERAAEIQEFIEKLMLENGIKPEPRFVLATVARAK